MEDEKAIGLHFVLCDGVSLSEEETKRLHGFLTAKGVDVREVGRSGRSEAAVEIIESSIEWGLDQFVGFGDASEEESGASLRTVGMIARGELFVCSSDLLLSGGSGNAEDLIAGGVVIFKLRSDGVAESHILGRDKGGVGEEEERV